MLSVYADPRMYVFTGGSPADRDQLRARYIHLAVGWNHDRTERWCNWIVTMHDSAEPVGAMQATVAADRTWAAIAWEVAVPMQGRGIASEAAIAVVGWLRDIGVHTIRASIHPDHAASAGVARRAGLVPTDEWDDGEIVWHLGAVL
jgi:RimJ/RimL family protein N-acetyltransferase